MFNCLNPDSLSRIFMIRNLVPILGILFLTFSCTDAERDNPYDPVNYKGSNAGSSSSSVEAAGSSSSSGEVSPSLSSSSDDVSSSSSGEVSPSLSSSSDDVSSSSSGEVSSSLSSSSDDVSSSSSSSTEEQGVSSSSVEDSGSSSSSLPSLEQCGTDYYNPENQRCENGIVETWCTGGQVGQTGGWYNGTNQKCENGVIENKCGNGWYNPTTHFCSKSNSIEPLCGTQEYDITKQFCDSRDKKLYGYIMLGAGTIQTWMAENLNHRGVEPDTVGKCYSNTNTRCDTYGRLYDWETAKKVCPQGWHLPSDVEWTTLTTFASTEPGKKLKASSGWNGYSAGSDPVISYSGNGSNTYGFTALPGGNYVSDFTNVGTLGSWWSATGNNSTTSYYRSMTNRASSVDRGSRNNTNLLSIRCLRD